MIEKVLESVNYRVYYNNRCSSPTKERTFVDTLTRIPGVLKADIIIFDNCEYLSISLDITYDTPKFWEQIEEILKDYHLI